MTEALKTNCPECKAGILEAQLSSGRLVKLDPLVTTYARNTSAGWSTYLGHQVHQCPQLQLFLKGKKTPPMPWDK
jgi:hypothetical protein